MLVVVRVRLVGVRDVDAVVAVVAHPVAIHIRLVDVRVEGTVVAQVAQLILVGVGLGVVGRPLAVVEHVTDTIVVVVEAGTTVAPFEDQHGVGVVGERAVVAVSVVEPAGAILVAEDPPGVVVEPALADRGEVVVRAAVGLRLPGRCDRGATGGAVVVGDAPLLPRARGARDVDPPVDVVVVAAIRPCGECHGGGGAALGPPPLPPAVVDRVAVAGAVLARRRVVAEAVVRDPVAVEHGRAGQLHVAQPGGTSHRRQRLRRGPEVVEVGMVPPAGRVRVRVVAVHPRQRALGARIVRLHAAEAKDPEAGRGLLQGRSPVLVAASGLVGVAPAPVGGLELRAVANRVELDRAAQGVVGAHDGHDGGRHPADGVLRRG